MSLPFHNGISYNAAHRLKLGLTKTLQPFLQLLAVTGGRQWWVFGTFTFLPIHFGCFWIFFPLNTHLPSWGWPKFSLQADIGPPANIAVIQTSWGSDRWMVMVSFSKHTPIYHCFFLHQHHFSNLRLTSPSWEWPTLSQQAKVRSLVHTVASKHHQVAAGITKRWDLRTFTFLPCC